MNHFTRNEWLAIALTIGGVAFLFGDELLLKMRSWRNAIRDEIQDSVSLEYEIERAKRRTGDLSGEVIRSREKAARQRTDLQQIRDDVREHEDQLRGLREKVLALRQQLDVGDDPSHERRDRTDDRDLRRELRRAFEAYRTAEATLDARREIMRIREAEYSRSLMALREIEQRGVQLQLQVENLVARLQLVRTKSDHPDVSPDPSEVSAFEEQLSRLDTRLAILESMLDEDRFSSAELALDLSFEDSDISAQVDRYFGQPARK